MSLSLPSLIAAGIHAGTKYAEDPERRRARHWRSWPTLSNTSLTVGTSTEIPVFRRFRTLCRSSRRRAASCLRSVRKSSPGRNGLRAPCPDSSPYPLSTTHVSRAGCIAAPTHHPASAATTSNQEGKRFHLGTSASRGCSRASLARLPPAPTRAPSENFPKVLP